MSLLFNYDDVSVCRIDMPVVVRDSSVRLRLVTVIDGPSRTHQSHKDLCDVNRIIARYERTGELPLATRPPQYADVSGLGGDLTEAFVKSQHVVETAEAFVKEKVSLKVKAADEARKEADVKRFNAAVEAEVSRRSSAPPAPVVPPA